MFSPEEIQLMKWGLEEAERNILDAINEIKASRHPSSSDQEELSNLHSNRNKLRAIIDKVYQQYP